VRITLSLDKLQAGSNFTSQIIDLHAMALAQG
jgi:hypothetical protein